MEGDWKEVNGDMDGDIRPGLIEHRKCNPWTYFIFALGWSYSFWIPLVLSGKEAMVFPWAILLGLGGLGPAIAGISLTYLTQSPEERKDYWRRLFDFRRISRGWWLVIILTFPILNGLGLVTGRLFFGHWPALENPQGFIANPLSLIPFALFTMFFGPFPEELGWSGYGIDRLQAHWSALASSLIMAGFWWAWHLPLFLISADGIAKLWPIGTLPFWINYTLGIPTMAILRTWVYNNNKRSILSAIFFHFVANLSGEFVDMPNEFQYLRTIWTLVMAAAVVLRYGKRDLAQGKTEIG